MAQYHQQIPALFLSTLTKPKKINHAASLIANTLHVCKFADNAQVNLFIFSRIFRDVKIFQVCTNEKQVKISNS